MILATALAILGLSLIGCSNGSEAAGGGESKNVSATQVEGGISVTVDIPEGCTIVYFYRQKTGSNYREAWYCNENTPSGSNTVVDYFVEENATYTYWVELRDSDWALKGNSDSVEITSSVKGFALPKVTNLPQATYNPGTRKFTFSTKPTFSYTQCPVDGYPNLKIELLYKCADNTWETICEYKLDEEQTGGLYSWILERYMGNTLTYHCIRYKFKSADGKKSYEFDIGLGANIPAIILGNYASIGPTSVDDFLGKTISTDRDMTADPSYTIEFQGSKTDGKVYSDEVWYHDDITVVIAPPANSSDTCLATLTKNNGITKDWDNYPVYFLTFGIETRVFVESMKLSKTTTTTGLQGVYLVGDENDYIKYTLGNNGAASFSYKHDDASDTITGTYTCNQGIIEIDLGTAGKQYLVYKSNGIVAIGEYFYLCG